MFCDYSKPCVKLCMDHIQTEVVIFFTCALLPYTLLDWLYLMIYTDPFVSPHYHCI